MIQVSNNPYGDTLAALGSRPRLDTGQLGVVSLVIDSDRGLRSVLSMAAGRAGKVHGLM